MMTTLPAAPTCGRMAMHCGSNSAPAANVVGAFV